MDWQGGVGRLHTLPDEGGSVGLGRSPLHTRKPTRGLEPWGAFWGSRAYLGLTHLLESQSHPRPCTMHSLYHHSSPLEGCVFCLKILQNWVGRGRSILCVLWVAWRGRGVWCGVDHPSARPASRGRGHRWNIGGPWAPCAPGLGNPGGPLGLRACLGPQCSALKTPRSQRHTFGFECLPSIIYIHIFICARYCSNEIMQ